MNLSTELAYLKSGSGGRSVQPAPCTNLSGVHGRSKLYYLGRFHHKIMHWSRTSNMILADGRTVKIVS